MTNCFKPFTLSEVAQQLADKAGRSLAGKKPLPRTTDENGVTTGAQGFQYDWNLLLQQLWDQVKEERMDELMAWSSDKKPPVRFGKSVVTLEPGNSLRTPEGMMSMIVPIDGLSTEVAAPTTGGNIKKSLIWRPSLGYELQAGTAIGATKDVVTFALIRAYDSSNDKAATGAH